MVEELEHIRAQLYQQGIINEEGEFAFDQERFEQEYYEEQEAIRQLYQQY